MLCDTCHERDAVVHLKTAPNRPAPVLAGDLAGLSVPPAGG